MAIIYVTADVRGDAPTYNPISSFTFENLPPVDAWECQGYTENGVYYGRYKDAFRVDTQESIPAELLRGAKFAGVELVDDAEEEYFLENVKIEVERS